MTRAPLPVVWFVALLALLPANVLAQAAPGGVQAAIVPDSLTVGEVVHAAIRLRVPPGVRVAFPDTLPMPRDAEGAGARELRTDTVDGQLELTAVYPVTAWRPGPLRLPPTSVLVLNETGTDTLAVTFAQARVRSVLPADTAGIEARPARDVLGGTRVWWPWLVGLLALLALAALALWAWRRRRRRQPAPFLVPAVPPREAALALLDRARALRLVENGELKRFYTLVAEAVRDYLDALDAAWGADLTTTELANALAPRHDEVRPALDALRRADLVKFARMRPDPKTAYDDWAAARAWVESFALPEPETLESHEPVAA